MSQPEYSATAVIDQYESDLSAWETQLQSLEEESKGFSLEDSEDKKDLFYTTHERLPDIADMYEQVTRSRRDAEELKDMINDVLENPKIRYTAVPESLEKQKRMKAQIEDLHRIYHFTDERQNSISYTLDEEFGMTVDDYVNQTPLEKSVDDLLRKTGTAMHAKKLQKTLSEDSEAAFFAGIILGSAGAMVSTYLRDKLDRKNR